MLARCAASEKSAIKATTWAAKFVDTALPCLGNIASSTCTCDDPLKPD